MKNSNLKSILFFFFILCSLGITAQDAPPSDDIYRLKNVETGKFLTDTGVSATAVTMTDLGAEDQSTHFKFVQSGTFYNIDSEILGILRAPGAGGPGGAFVVVSTTKASPAADADKVWTIQHNQTDDTYRFQSGNSGRFMYHDANGTVTHVAVSATDDRSNWELVPFVEIPVEIAPDEDTNTDLNCPASGEFENNSTRNVDLPNPVNVGTADDRSCYSDYSESNVYGKNWGVYNITDGSNHWDAPNTLQPRIERSLPRSGETGVGSYARFTGVFRILEVGDAGSFSQNGTYIAQAKGKHTGGGGSNDPAICLYLAKPVYGTGINADKQVAFDIYAERILERGGEGSGREVVLLKRVNKNEEIDFELEVGFREDPNDATKKIHYCDAVIGGDAFNYNIPEPDRGLESGIRYGVYRVRGGRAQIRWANTTYQREEVIDNGNSGPSDDIYRLRNVETGKFLTDSGVSASPVTMSDSGEAQNTHWTFVESGAFFNIDSETFGILRAPGAGGPGGAYVVVSTSKASPASDGDKVWTIQYNATNETYRFQSGTSGRYLYHEANGTVTHIQANETDNRSVWQAIPTSVTLSLDKNKLVSSQVRVFPNPANDSFTMAFKNLNQVKVEIFDMLGKTVFKSESLGENLKVNNNGQFKSGVYLIRVVDGANKVYNTKLVIK
ncbi:T9SS type A sorting domain-containing protein [uncultured Algibacter sp.]|uniref:T9SS type A sorting domain-containing protein n=1 Tax=uncultured Algibacter sp. TaxID=298659 RepID=UPI0026149A1E|nr:T9SS type A sorting domain-containing protein [uncultured Algibacter sp.]